MTQKISAPLRVFGGGTYTLSAVKAIDGTEQYIRHAEKTGQCQNKETQENCHTREYLSQGLEQCSCVPFVLRNYSKQVTWSQSKLPTPIPYSYFISQQ